MKKLMMIAIALLTLTVTAQDKKGKKEFLKDLSAEELATLKTKKMTLHLDLTKEQQLRVKSLVLKEAQYRKQQKEKFEEKKKDKTLSKEERLAITNERLDRKIELKKQMKNILTEEQYQKWESTLQQKGKRKQKKHHRNKSSEKQ